jgi:hypothetical protein
MTSFVHVIRFKHVIDACDFMICTPIIRETENRRAYGPDAMDEIAEAM